MPRSANADPAAIMGCGNFDNGKAGIQEGQQFAVLKAAGVKSCRMPLYPYTYYWAHQRATPERFDDAALQAHSFGITPVLLFEYYTRFPTPLGGYQVWHDIGQSFATRFRPNSPWWLAQGIADYGVTVYAAINEPDIDKPMLTPHAYHDALKGLADGVHAAGAELKVVPGGLAGPNSHSDYQCGGLVPAIADLLNDGSLDGLDLHTYNGRWAPLADHQHSAQHDFDAVKKACGITRDIHFYTTEFNYQQATGEGSTKDIGDTAAGSYFLTMIWDNLGVVGNQGACVTQLALCWNLFNTTVPDTEYAMCTSLSPWTPNARGTAYQLVAGLTQGMSLVKSDPYHAGSLILTGDHQTMWVWQDRPHWTDFPGAACTLAGVPSGATELKIYGYDGLRKTISLTGSATVHVSDLPGNETYMFLADGADDVTRAAVGPYTVGP